MAARAIAGKYSVYQHEPNINIPMKKKNHPTVREVLSQIESHEYRSIEHLVSLLIVVWTCLAGTAAYFHDVQSIFEFVYRETARVVLSGSWPKVDQNHKRGLARALVQCSQVLGSRVENSQSLCSSLVMTIYDPWGDPSIGQLIKNEDIDEKTVADFVESEPTELMLVRIEFLVSANLEDCAIRLCRYCLKRQRVNNNNNNSQENDDLNQHWKLPFMEWLSDLLFRQRRLNQLIQDCQDFSCHDGLLLIRRILENKKLDFEALAETLINLFLIRNLLFQSTYCCTKDLMQMWCDSQIRKQSTIEEVQADARKLIVNHASSSAHFYVFIDTLWEKYGMSLLPLYLEFFIRGLTSDLNFLEAAHQADAKESVIEIENHMASVYYKLSTLFLDVSKDISVECMLSSFSLDPTRDKLDIIKKLTMQIAMANAKRTSVIHPLNSVVKDGRQRPVLGNSVLPKRNPVVMCDRGIQVGESPYSSFASTPEDKVKEDSLPNLCQPKPQDEHPPRNVENIMEVVTETVNRCLDHIQHQSNLVTSPAKCDHEEVNVEDHSEDDNDYPLPICITDVVQETVDNMIDKIVSSSQNKLSLSEHSELTNHKVSINHFNESTDLTSHCDNKCKSSEYCNGISDTTPVQMNCAEPQVNKTNIVSSKNVNEDTNDLSITSTVKDNEKHQNGADNIGNCTNMSVVMRNCTHNSGCPPNEPNLCKAKTSNDINHILHKRKSWDKEAYHNLCPNEAIVKIDDSICRQYLAMQQARNSNCKRRSVSVDKVNCSSLLFRLKVMNLKLPGVSSNLLADFIVILESLRSQQLRVSTRWSEIKPACEEYMDNVSTMRSTFMNMQLNGNIDSEDDSFSEVAPMRKEDFTSFQSDDSSVYHDPNVDKSTILKRFMNTTEDIKFSTFVNLSDIHHPYLHLDRLLCIGALSTRHEHGKHHRRHRDKGRDAKKAVLKHLLHGAGYNHDLTKRKKKKRKRGRKEKSHNKKHHSTHVRDVVSNKKKKRQHTKKKKAIDFAGGDYCSDFSSTELMRLVNEHSSSFPHGGMSHAEKRMASGSESCSGSNMPSKKKRKQVSFKKLKEKKNTLIKTHDKRKHSKSKRDKKKSNHMQDYSHIVEFSSVKEMQSVRIRQSSMSVANNNQGGTREMSEHNNRKIPMAMNPSCSDEDMRNIQMLLVNKQSSPAVVGGNSFEENLLFNKQTVLKYVSSKTTSHLLSVAQASNRILMPSSEIKSASNSLTSESLLSQGGKCILAGKKLIPISGAPNAHIIQRITPVSTITTVTSPVITTLTLPLNQSIAGSSGSTKLLSGKFMIPLGSATSPIPAGMKPIMSVIPAGSPLYNASNLILVKKGNDNLPINAHQLQNILPITNKLSIAPPPPPLSSSSLFPNRKCGQQLNRVLPNTARKVVKKYTQPTYSKKPSMILWSTVNKSTVGQNNKVDKPVTSKKDQDKLIAISGIKLDGPKNVPDPPVPSPVSEISSIREIQTTKVQSSNSVAKPLVSKEVFEDKIVTTTMTTTPSSSSITMTTTNLETKVDVSEKSSAEKHPCSNDSDVIEKRVVEPMDLEDTESKDKSSEDNGESSASSESDEKETSKDIYVEPMQNDDALSEKESSEEPLDNHIENLTAMPKRVLALDSSDFDVAKVVEAENLSKNEEGASSISTMLAMIDITQLAHKTQLQPLTAITSTLKTHTLSSKSDVVGQPDGQTRSLTSISDAVRFSLMDMDDATGSVENQVLQAFHSFPQETVAFTAQESVNTTESIITTLTTSSNVISSQASETYQSTVRTSQNGSFSECQMTASSSTSREWNSSDPAALVSSILATKSLENDSASEIKDEERIKKKRKKKEKTEKDPEAIQRFWCEICNRGFFSAYNLRRHCRNVHKMDLPKGTSDVPFSSSSSQCLTMVGDRVICSAVSEAGTQSVTTPIGGGNKTPEFIMQSPPSDPKTKEFTHQTSPPSHTKQIQQQVAQALNQSPNFTMHSPPITPPKEFRLQAAVPTSVGQPQQNNFMNVGTTLPKPVPKFQMIQSHASGLSHPIPRLGSVIHQPTVSASSQMAPPLSQPRLIPPSSGGLIPKPPEIQTSSIVQPVPCQVQQGVQCPLNKKQQDQRPVMLPSSQLDVQEQALRIARHTAEVQAQKTLQQQQQQAFKKSQQMSKADALPQVPIQISQAGVVSHIQPPILNPQMQKLVQIRQAALCRSPEFTLQLPVQGAVADSHTSPVKSPIQYFQTQVSSPQHQSVLHSAAVRQTLASCAAVRQAAPGYIGQPIQNVANAEFLSRLVPHTSQERPSCAQPFSAMSTSDLCLVSNPTHAPVIRQSTETSEGLEDLEQFLLENMVWGGGGGGEMTSQVQQTLSRPDALPVTMKQTVGNMPPSKLNPLNRNKPTVTKPKACKPLTPASKNYAGSKSCMSKKKSCNKKSQELGCSESLKSGFASVPGVPLAEKKSCGPKNMEIQGEKTTNCCAIGNTPKDTSASCTVDENDSVSSDSVQCLEITRNAPSLKSVTANFNTVPHVEARAPGFYKLPTFCNPSLRGTEHAVNPVGINFGIAGNVPILNARVSVSQPVLTHSVSSVIPQQRMPVMESTSPLNSRQHVFHCGNNAMNYQSSKCPDELSRCTTKQTTSTAKQNSSSSSDSLSCIPKNAVDPVISIFDPTPTQTDNLDAEKELRNLQNKISDCEKHLKSSENSNKEAEAKKDDLSSSRFEIQSKDSMTNSNNNDGDKPSPFLSSKETENSKLAVAMPSDTRMELPQVNKVSPEKTSDKTKSQKGIHFLDDQSDKVTPPHSENSLFPMFSGTTSLQNKGTKDVIETPFLNQKNVNSTPYFDKSGATGKNCVDMETVTYKAPLSSKNEYTFSTISASDLKNLQEQQLSNPKTNSKACEESEHSALSTFGNNFVTSDIHGIHGLSSQNGRNEYDHEKNHNFAKVSEADVAKKIRTESHPNAESILDGNSQGLKPSDSEMQTVTSGRTRLRDTPKTSVKRSCPCCTDSCAPKKCRTNSSSNSMSLFINKLPKTNMQVRPNGPQKTKNMIPLKTKINQSAQVKTRSSHRLRSRNGSII